jgi:hypothetical protein
LTDEWGPNWLAKDNSVIFNKKLVTMSHIFFLKQKSAIEVVLSSHIVQIIEFFNV